MILLDTDVLSALMQRTPDRKIEDWVNGLPRSSVWTTSITLYEIQVGIQALAAGRRRSELELCLEKLRSRLLTHRIAAFDASAAEQAAQLAATPRTTGPILEERNRMIAGIALAHQATLATSNVRHFENMALTLVNPWAV